MSTFFKFHHSSKLWAISPLKSPMCNKGKGYLLQGIGGYYIRGKHTELSKSEAEFYDNPQVYSGYDRSILMVGITGSGKSSFGNFLANNLFFSEGFGMIPSTAIAHGQKFQFKNEEVLIIDSPGFCDAKRPVEEIQEEICKVGVMAKDGTDAVAIVVNSVERFSDNHCTVLEHLDALGGALWDHAFLVFTKEAQIIEDYKVRNGADYIEMVRRNPNCPPVLTEWMKKTRERYVCVESKRNFNNETYRGEICRDIFRIIDQIRSDTGNVKYTNIMMNQGAKLWRQIAKVKQAQNEAKEFRKLMEQQNLEDKKAIEEGIKKQKELEKEMNHLKEEKEKEIADLKAKAEKLAAESSCFSYQTKILLANKELKDISEIKKGEMVDTPNGPREVALVSTFKRYRDHLYTINNLQFRFNKYHPFVVYDQTDMETTSFAVIDPNAFIDFMPTMASRRIKSLYDQDTNLSGYVNGGGLTPISIENISESSDELPSEYDVLYDVILEPNGTGMNEYYAGDGDQMFLVSSEISIYTLESERQYIPAYITILSIINKTSEQQQQQQIEYVLNTENDVINFFENEIVQNGVELLSNAALKMSQFQSLHLKQTPITINEIEKRIKQTLHFFSQPKPIAVTTLSLIYEYLQTLIGPLHTMIKLGWRSYARAEEKDKLAVGIADIAFVTQECFNHNIEVLLMTSTDQAPYLMQEKGNSSNPRVRPIHDSIYIPLNQVNANKLHLIVKEKKSGKMIARKCIRLEADFDYDYRLLKLFAHDNANISEVRVNMDIRMVSDGQMERELRAKQEWSEELEIDYAEEFASKIVDCLVEKVQA